MYEVRRKKQKEWKGMETAYCIYETTSKEQIFELQDFNKKRKTKV
jgi:hypothetical protein